MARTSIFYITDANKYAALMLDAVVSREFAKQVEVTRFPIEDGSTISDHAILRPDMIRLEGVVTDRPIETKAEIEAGVNLGKASSARSALEAICNGKKPVSLDAGGRTYSNFILARLNFPEGGDLATVNACRFAAEFEKITTQTTATAPVASTKPAKAKGGKKPTSPASDAVTKKTSAFKALADKLRSKAPTPFRPGA